MSKRLAYSFLFFSTSVVGLIALTATPASAVKEFKDAFQSKYVKANSTAANDASLAAAVEQAGCTICHVGENKKIRNAYGKQLAKLITKRDKQNKAKIVKAMDTVAQMKSKPGDTNSPTFGEKISSGKLPAAE